MARPPPRRSVDAWNRAPPVDVILPVLTRGTKALAPFALGRVPLYRQRDGWFLASTRRSPRA